MIKILKEHNADTRSAEEPITVYALEDSTKNHIGNVRQGLLYFAEMLNGAGWNHDFTKLAYLEEFHDALTDPDIPVKESKWYSIHINRERHHLLSKAPDDINLVDVIEHLVDCVMAGMGRTGEVFDIDLPDELLQKAHKNTVELLKSNVEVVGGDSDAD